MEYTFGCCVKPVNFFVQIGLKADVNIYGDRTEVKARYAKTEQYQRAIFYLPSSLSSL